jgi:LysR family glycine cleavage system transcriptional activator
MTRLPPLNALRAFEAAARHLSFTRAADELAVTQAAVSHQVKALEDWLGRRLFHRVTRGLRLTDGGQALLPVLSESFERIGEAIERLGRDEDSRRLTLSTTDSFAAAWLVPRLRRFRDAEPGIEVHVTTSDTNVDFSRSDVDMAVRYGTGPWPGLHTVPLFEEDVFPVCSPKLLTGEHPLREPGDLRFHTLLHDDMPETWRQWLTAAGVKGVDPDRGPSFMRSNLVILAALDGEGVALGRSRLVAHHLAEGRLVRPFALSLPARFAFFIVCPEQTKDRPKIRVFREWLVAEAKRDKAALGEEARA